MQKQTQRPNPKQPSSHRHCYQYFTGAKPERNSTGTPVQLHLSDLPNDDSRGRTAFNFVPRTSAKIKPD